MSDSSARDSSRDHAISVEAISSERIESGDNVWTRRLVIFLRIMAVVSVFKGLYHWAQVTGFVGGEEEAFENQSLAWQASTIYFAVIELVAAVGLWLATPWGAVVWLITVVSMTVIELMFPAIYGGSLAVVGAEALMLSAYLALAWMAPRVEATTYHLAKATDSVVGDDQTVTTVYEDTLYDLARKYSLGSEEVIRVNPGIDPWLPGADKQIIIPGSYPIEEVKKDIDSLLQ